MGWIPSTSLEYSNWHASGRGSPPNNTSGGSWGHAWNPATWHIKGAKVAYRLRKLRKLGHTFWVRTILNWDTDYLDLITNFVRNFGADVQSRKDWVAGCVICNPYISVFTDGDGVGDLFRRFLYQRLPANFSVFQTDKMIREPNLDPTVIRISFP